MKTTLKQQLEAFEQGKFIDSEGNENDCYNFYDWFCSDKALKAKSEKLFKMVKRWVEQRNTDIEKVYVFFKNNCPINGPLYDDFRICDVETGDVIWIVIPKCGHSGLAEVWGKHNGFKEAIITGKNMNEIYKQSF
jgi:uncharacterized protein YerC